MTMAYHRYHKVDTHIVRIFNTYGPRMRLNDGRALPNFVYQALSGKPLTIYGDGKQTRSFCYVSDLIEGICRLMMSDEHLPVNIGNPQEITILEFAERIRKHFDNAPPIEFANNIPLRTHQRGIGVLQSLVGILVIVHLRKEGLSARHAFRVCRMHGGAFFEQALDDFKRRSKANVVGVGLEGQPKDGHALAFYNPQRLMDFLKEPVDALLVDALSGFQNLELHANLADHMDERLYVLWRTETTITSPAFEELAPDPRSQTHS